MKISIITITYNSEKTLRETIESVKNQNFDGGHTLEYIIIDGKSTDSTLDIVKEYYYSGVVRKYISEPDKGISDAFNKGINMAEGEVIGIINSDDMLLPGAIQTIIENYNDETDVFFGNGKRLHEDGSLTDYNANTDLENLKEYMSLFHPSVFVKKSAYEKYGLFDTNLKCVMDRELLLRMYIHGASFKYINQPMALFRDGGISNKQYFTRVLPEEELISIRYGEKPLKAKLHRIKSWVYMHCVFAIKKLKGKM